MFRAHSNTLQEPSPSISLACLQVVCEHMDWSKAQSWHLLSKKYQQVICEISSLGTTDICQAGMSNQL